MNDMRVETAAENLVFSTVRIETNCGIGTGFFVDYELGKKNYRFLVTNKHVIAGANTGRLLLTKSSEDGSLMLGKGVEYTLTDFTTGWFSHPQMDVSVLPFVPFQMDLEKKGLKIFIRSIPIKLIPTKEQLEELDALEEVIFIGYPTGIFDKKNLLPIIRKGITATPISTDYEGLPQFLVDASVFPGSSGSPVLLYNRGIYTAREGTVVGNRLFFCGIMSAVFCRSEIGEMVSIDVPAAAGKYPRVEEKIDLGIVIKSEIVKDLIELFLTEKGIKTKLETENGKHETTG